MRVYVQLTDENGAVFEGVAELVPALEGRKRVKSSAQERPRAATAIELDFKLNERAFMKKYGQGLSGSQKFTLLLARFAEGKIGAKVSHDQVKSTWDRMKSIMGGAYNGAHAVRAKDQGWVDSPERGVYVLAADWKTAFTGDSI